MLRSHQVPKYSGPKSIRFELGDLGRGTLKTFTELGTLTFGP